MLYADLGWSWVPAASSFAGVAGILAAFTISAIILVLSIRPPGTADDDTSWHLLFYAFLVSLYSFIATALLFADITGDTDTKDMSRSYFTGMFAGTMMAIAVAQLLLAIIWSGAKYAPKMSLLGAKVLFAVVTILAGLLAFIDNGDFFTATSKTGTYWLDEHPMLGWAGLLLLVVFPVGLGMVFRQIPRRRRRGDATTIYKVTLWVSGSVTTLLIAAVSVLREANPADLPTIYTPWMSAGVMGFVGICLFFFTLSLPVGKTKEVAK